jgi:hypothetical protein
MTQQNNWGQLMKHTVELSHKELEEAIREYLLKNGYCLSDPAYGTPLKFILGKLEVGTQREPETIETVTKVVCTLV